MKTEVVLKFRKLCSNNHIFFRLMKTEVVLKFEAEHLVLKATEFNENRSCIEIQNYLEFHKNYLCLMKTEVVLKL